MHLPQTVQAEVRNGALTAGHARALLAHPDPAKAALSVIQRGLNVRQTEALAVQTPAQSMTRLPPVQDPDTAALERSLSQHLGLKVTLAYDGVGGTLRIRYRTLDQLDGLVSLLTRD
jgi:ParB family chromosome partitioning protein